MKKQTIISILLLGLTVTGCSDQEDVDNAINTKKDNGGTITDNSGNKLKLYEGKVVSYDLISQEGHSGAAILFVTIRTKDGAMTFRQTHSQDSMDLNENISAFQIGNTIRLTADEYGDYDQYKLMKEVEK